MIIVIVLIAVALLALLALLALPIVASVVVSLASVREDRAWSLTRKPQNAADAAARRIVGFYAEGTVPEPKSHTARPAEDAGPATGGDCPPHVGLASAPLSRDDVAAHADLLVAVR